MSSPHSAELHRAVSNWIPRSALAWTAAAFAAGVVLNIDREPLWVSVAAFLFVLWRLLAATRLVWVPDSIVRSLLAGLLVAAVLGRFHTLNGLSAGTALLILMGGIKLLETRAQRDQFIVIGAALFLLLAACLDRQELLRSPLYVLHAWLCCTALAVVAYAMDGSAHPRAVLSTQAITAPAPASFGNRAAIALAGRSLAFALPLALLLFLFFPRLPGAFWAIPRGDAAVTGLGDTMSPGSITQLTASYDVAFRARFDGPPPPPEERYWRGPVLHDFDGYTWRRTANNLYRTQPLEYLGKAYRYRISLEPSLQRWWFSLDTADAAPGPRVFLTYDYLLISPEPVTEPTSYALVSHTRIRATGELSVLARHVDTELPAHRNPRSHELALQLRGHAGSDLGFVRGVLDFLRTGGFQYSLTPPRLGGDSVDDFLFDSRTGFCGHYASAFVALMRAGGVPARVVTGYLGGEWNPIGNYFIVRQSDAHSWAEVWLEGRGWIRVDPTAVVEPERLRRGILDLLPNAVSAPARFVWSNPWLAATLQRWDAINAWWNDRVMKFNYDDQIRLLERLGFKSPGVRELGWAFAAALLGWLLWVAIHIGRAPPGGRPDRLARAYARLCSKLAGAGAARQSHLGPLAYADEVTKRRPDLAQAVRSLLMRYAQLRYDPPASASHAARVMDFEREIDRLRLGPVTERRPR